MVVDSGEDAYLPARVAVEADPQCIEAIEYFRTAGLLARAVYVVLKQDGKTRPEAEEEGRRRQQRRGRRRAAKGSSRGRDRWSQPRAGRVHRERDAGGKSATAARASGVLFVATL